MISVKPKKNLGQHFLKDSAIASRIADTLDAFAPLPILEVGHLATKDFAEGPFHCRASLGAAGTWFAPLLKLTLQRRIAEAPCIILFVPRH